MHIETGIYLYFECQIIYIRNYYYKYLRVCVSILIISFFFLIVIIIIYTGALWDTTFRDDKHRSQLLLLIEALPLKADDWPSYMMLLSKALKAGLSANAEDSRGCNALFLLCEKLAYLPQNTFAETIRLVRLLVANDDKSWDIIDHTGRSLADIEERVPNSCLSVVRNMFMKNVNTSSLSNMTRDKVYMNNNNGYKRMNDIPIQKSSGRSASVGRRGLVIAEKFDDSVGTWEEISSNRNKQRSSASLLKSWRNSNSEANVLMSSINGSISTSRA